MYFVSKIDTEIFKKNQLVRFIVLCDFNKTILVEDANDMNKIEWFNYNDLYNLPFYEDKLTYNIECQLIGKSLLEEIL